MLQLHREKHCHINLTNKRNHKCIDKDKNMKRGRFEKNINKKKYIVVDMIFDISVSRLT